MRVLLLSICIAILAMGRASGATWYVDDSVSSSGDGTSWATAFKTVQAGIDASFDDDTVIVAEGTYVENIRFGGKSITLTSTAPLDPAVVAATIIDGNESGPVVAFSGTETESCVLSGFTITNGAPGIYGKETGVEDHTHAAIQNNITSGNSAQGSGGGLAFCNGIVQNDLVTANSAQHYGGGLYWCDATLHSNTITRNSASYGGGMSDCHGAIGNSVFWGNSAPTGPQIYNCATLTYSCIQGWTEAGEGNIAPASAGFVDPDGPDDNPATWEDNNYRLQGDSPCIDNGENEDWMNGALDLDGKPRILLGATSLTVDMGAYEYRFDLAVARNIESNIELSWTMLPMTSYTVLSSFDVTAQPWAEETTIPGGKTGGPAVWADPAASSALKFYRIEIR